jgi:hypothetical protein
MASMRSLISWRLRKAKLGKLRSLKAQGCHGVLYASHRTQETDRGSSWGLSQCLSASVPNRLLCHPILLLFHHAAREPEFRQQMDRFHRAMVATARRELANIIPDRAWAQWAAQLAPVVAIEAVMAWLDAGQPDPDQAADRIQQVLAGVISAAQ